MAEKTRLDHLDKHEMEDVARSLDKEYTPEKFEKDFDEFIQIKKSVIRHRSKEAKKLARRKTVH